MADRLERIRALATRVEDGRLRRESADTIDIHMRQMAFDLRWLLDEVDRLRSENGGKHLHHAECIHNLPPEEQVAMRGKTVEWWTRIIGALPEQITPEQWETEPPEVHPDDH